MKSREVAIELRKRFPGIVFTMRQLWTCRWRLRKEAMKGYNPFPTTILLLNGKGIPYTVKWAKSPNGDDIEDENGLKKPEGLFWTTPWTEKQWGQYPWVQLYDNTYKTNNKNLAFFQVVALNHQGKAFSCAFGLINNERRDGFDWLMEQVDAARLRAGAQPPGVTITDFDTAMRGAVAAKYPEAKPQVCVFHLNKNAALQIKKKWNKEAAARVAEALGLPLPLSQADDESNLNRAYNESVIDRSERSIDGEPGRAPETVEYSMAGIYKLWESVVYAYTEDEFEAAWEKLQAYFHHQTAILQYLRETWIPYKEQWAGCYINRNLNFGQRTTSPVESVNRYLKSFIITGRSSVLDCVKQSLEMVKAMESNIDEALKDERNRLRFDFLGKDWLGDAPYNVSAKALNLVTKQRQIMLGAIPTKTKPNPTPLVDCTHRVRAQYGLPCSHELLERHREKSPLTRDDFHRFWWLKRGLAAEDPLLRIQEFDVVTTLKGRPRRSTAFASNGRKAPILTAPPPGGSQLDQEDEVVIPATQPPTPQPTRNSAPKKAAPRKKAAKKQTPGRQSGIMPSLHRNPSSWEGVDLERSQTTVSLTPGAGLVSSNPGVIPSTPSSTAMVTASAPVGITKRGGGVVGTRRSTRKAPAPQRFRE